MKKNNTYGFIRSNDNSLDEKKIISRYCSSKNILIAPYSISLYLKLDYMDENDTLVLISLKHVADNSNELISFFHKVTKNGIRLVVLEEEIDMPATVSSLFAYYFETFKDLSQTFINNSPQKRARGRNGGRPKVTYNPEEVYKAEKAYKLYKENYSISEILKKTKIKSKATLYKYIRNHVEYLAKKNNKKISEDGLSLY